MTTKIRGDHTELPRDGGLPFLLVGETKYNSGGKKYLSLTRYFMESIQLYGLFVRVKHNVLVPVKLLAAQNLHSQCSVSHFGERPAFRKLHK
jgi:hypothetical protein